MKRFFTLTVMVTLLGIVANAQTVIEAESAATLTGKIKINNAADGLDGIKVDDLGVVTTATYTNVSISETADYTIYFNTSGFQNAARIILEVDGIEKGYANLIAGGDWSTYSNSNALVTNLTAGSHTFKLTFSHDQQFDGDDLTNYTGYLCNIDYFSYEKGVPASIKTLPVSDVNIYPLPADEMLTVELKESGRLTVYNLAGVMVYENLDAGTNSQINVSEFQKGIYLLKVETASGYLTQKVVVN